MSKTLLEKLSEFLHVALQKTEIKPASYPFSVNVRKIHQVSILFSQELQEPEPKRKEKKRKKINTHACILTIHTKTKKKQSTLIKYMRWNL